MAAFYKGFVVAILSAILLYFITDHVIGLGSVFTVEDKSFSMSFYQVVRSNYYWFNHMGH